MFPGDHDDSVLAEAMFRTVFETSSAAMVVIEDDTTITLVNSQGVALLGYAKEQIEGGSWREFVVADDLKTVEEYHRLRRTDPSTVPSNYELHLRDGHGQTRTVRLSVSVIPGTRLSVASMTDVTELKREEERLVRMAPIIESLDNAIIHNTVDGRVAAWNAGAAMMYGYQAAEIKGQSIYTLIPAEYRHQTLQVYNTVRSSAKVYHFESEHISKDGRVFPVSVTVSPVRDTDGVIIGTLTVTRDITDERLIQKSLTSRANHRIILDSIQCGVLVIDPETHRIIDANSVASNLIGATREDVIGSLCYEYICPGEKGRCPITAQNRMIDRAERELVTVDGERIPIIKTVVPVTLDDKKYLLESFVDISERKQVEDQLKFLSLHDPLTGLYNRTYFEQEMRRSKIGRRGTVGIVVCDLDALKFVNDTLGHEVGDRLLVAAASILKKCFRASDMVARIGGDEFAVLLPNSTHATLEKSYRRIKSALARHNAANPDLPMSISVGYALSSRETESIADLFKEADNNMYREKLRSNESTRSATFKVLLKALEERDFITEGHAERLQNMVVGLALQAGVPHERLNDLRLLARFHDTGKVGVPDTILFKPGPLTPDEAAEMQRHCEIGYRIAQSLPELVMIADWILKHHEWWNGQGYPLGLKGEEIPIESRILALADAYDAMTSDRPYRKAMSREAALDEIRRGMGTQFDPVLAGLFVGWLTERPGVYAMVRTQAAAKQK